MLERSVRFVLTAVAVLVIASCGAGGGTETTLPPGNPTTAPPGDLVLYAALSNDDRIVAYRLGTDGFLPAQPFDSMAVENPRDLLLNDGVLYAALEDRVVAMKLGADGSLPGAPTSQTNPTVNAGGTDLLIRDGILYVAFEGIGRVCSFVLENGQLPPDPLSTSGTSTSDYRVIVTAGGYLYAASLSDAQIDTYLIQPDGSLPESPETQDPNTVVYRAEDMLIANGFLYVIAQGRDRIETHEIQANGLPNHEYDTRTSGVQRYARILLDGDRLYASGFGKGRIDLFILEPDGSLPSDPFARTAPDAATFPTNMILRDGILYVTQSGPGRIDAYVLGADGSPSVFPSSSTDNMDGSTPLGLTMGSFPP